jgi:hypothetical protein
MTRYAIDEARGEPMAVRETGYGVVALRLAPLPDRLEDRDRRALAAELSGLSEALWRCYTHPASAADSLEVNTEGWRREQTRDGFALVVDHIRTPNLPDKQGSLIVSYDPVEERAHRVGRCLHHAADVPRSLRLKRTISCSSSVPARASKGLFGMAQVTVDRSFELRLNQGRAAAAVPGLSGRRGKHVPGRRC